MDAVFYNINLANGCQRAAMPHATHTHTLAVNSGNFLMVDINTKPKSQTIKKYLYSCRELK